MLLVNLGNSNFYQKIFIEIIIHKKLNIFKKSESGNANHFVVCIYVKDTYMLITLKMLL